MIKDVFFDLDRTLWDFDRNSNATLEDIFNQHQLDKYIDDFQLFKRTYRTVNDYYWNAYRVGKVSKEKLQDYRFIDTLKEFEIHDEKLGKVMGEEFLKLSPEQTHLFPFAIEILKDLKENNYRLHIITNGFIKVQHTKLQVSGLRPYFDEILCSEEIGVNKPNPKVFYEALKRAKAEISQSIMIGDDLNCDVIGAENIGMKAILFDPEDKYLHSSPKVKNLQEIPELIVNI